jgi:EAL domain-containing protein (putative c-di-GMP-specific phosphodiesterase class I)
VHPDAIWGLFLESTDGLLMEYIQNKVAGLRSIQSTGVSLAIDDFGSGLSSLKRAVETAFRYP